jgi:hypothetical protein
VKIRRQKNFGLDVLLAGLHKAVEGVNATTVDGLQAAVVDGLLAATDTLS